MDELTFIRYYRRYKIVNIYKFNPFIDPMQALGVCDKFEQNEDKYFEISH